MRRVFAAAVLAGLLVGGAVAAVRALTRESAGGSDSTGAVSARRGSPQATADAFAAGWTSGDTNALYLLLDPASQRAIPYPVFAAAYSQFDTEITETDLQARTVAAKDGSATLAVHLSTAYFGDFEYSTTLILTRGPSNWLVAWDPTAIHPDLANGRSMKSDVQRPTRGAILDRNGVQLAVTRDVRFLGLNRSLVTDRAAVTAKLVAFGFSRDQVDRAFASTAGPKQRVAVGQVSDEKRDEAVGLANSVPGLLLYLESQRVHPLGPAAAHVVGYTREFTAEELAKRRGTGYRPGDRTGAVGLELSQDAVLAGKPGGTLRVVEADSTTTYRTLATTEFVPGRDVRTTLDANTLRAAAGRLANRPGAAVVIDPRSNSILALNSSPSFDPDAFERNDAAALDAITRAPNGPLTNRATSGLYSAGSTFKLVTGAAGLVYGGFTPHDEINCTAVWNGLDPPRHNWEGSQGPLTIAEGLMRSCNTVFYQIGLTLYNKTDGALSKMAKQFGFGAATGVVGLGEEDGQVPDAAWKKAKNGQPWYPGDEVNLAIGQGDLLITPLQLANAYSAFVNNDLRTPVVLAGQPATDRGALPLTPAQHDHLLLGLKLVTGPRGTASAAFAFAGYNDFAGKSGTAEDVGTQQHVLFVAMSPANAPRAICAVVLDDGQSGSIEAGPIARDLVLVAIK